MSDTPNPREFDVDVARRLIVRLCDSCSDHDVYIARIFFEQSKDAYDALSAELKAKHMECESLKNARDDRTEALFALRTAEARVAELEAERDELKVQFAALNDGFKPITQQEYRYNLEALEKQVEKEERDHMVTIEQRDFREEQIDQIADILGDETEWTSSNDRGVNAIELVSEIKSRLAECADKHLSLAEKFNKAIDDLIAQQKQNAELRQWAARLAKRLAWNSTYETESNDPLVAEFEAWRKNADV